MDVPIVFTKPGTYDIGGGQQRTAFAQGTIYFRHGSKSEPGNREDLAAWRDREIAKVRKSWLGGIRKVVQAEATETVTVISSPRAIPKEGEIVVAQVSADPTAVKVVPGNAEEIWPHRQKDLIRIVNRRLEKHARVNTHDMFCIKTVYDIINKRPDFAYRSHHMAPPQYSDAFADWIIEEFHKDRKFFERVRAECRSMVKK